MQLWTMATVWDCPSTRPLVWSKGLSLWHFSPFTCERLSLHQRVSKNLQTVARIWTIGNLMRTQFWIVCQGGKTRAQDVLDDGTFNFYIQYVLRLSGRKSNVFTEDGRRYFEQLKKDCSTHMLSNWCVLTLLVGKVVNRLTRWRLPSRKWA